MQEDDRRRRTSPRVSQPPSPRPASPSRRSRSSSPRRSRSSSPCPPSPLRSHSPSSPPSGFDSDDTGDDRRPVLLPVHDYPPTRIPKIRTALDFIEMVRDATLASQFEDECLEELLQPREHESVPPDDPDLMLSVLNYTSLMVHSQSAYEDARQNVQLCHPDIKLLSYYQVGRRARNLSGIVAWEHHMCSNSCVGFTGPYALWNNARTVESLVIRKTRTTNGRPPERSLRRFRSAHKSRLGGNTPRQPRTCPTGGRRR